MPAPLIAALPWIVGGLGSLFGGIFGGKQKEITPQPIPYMLPGQLERLADWIFSPMVFNKEANTWELRGAPQYPGQINPNLEETRLPEVWQSWQPWDGGMSSLAQNLNRQAPSWSDQYRENLALYGGIGGYPTELMSNIAQFGGTGGPANEALGLAMQFGAPSKVGDWMSNLAQFGIASPAGQLIADRAYGRMTPAQQFLVGFQKPTRANAQIRRD